MLDCLCQQESSSAMKKQPKFPGTEKFKFSVIVAEKEEGDRGKGSDEEGLLHRGRPLRGSGHKKPVLPINSRGTSRVLSNTNLELCIENLDIRCSSEELIPIRLPPHVVVPLSSGPGAGRPNISWPLGPSASSLGGTPASSPGSSTWTPPSSGSKRLSFSSQSSASDDDLWPPPK